MHAFQAPLDDTVQLDEMSGFSEEDDFPTTNDKVRIIRGGVADEDRNGGNTRVAVRPGDGHRDGDTAALCRGRPVSSRAIMSVIILTGINLLNYMDRFTVAGVLLQIQNYYHINQQESGLLQTAFISSYMIFSPIFGFLGDRYRRKVIMACGITFWSCITMGSSFVGKGGFWGFLAMRGLVGIGEASYSTIAPTIIADLFVKDQRTKALAVFYFAIPVGSGLGYIVGAQVAKALGSWQWALRVTPALGVVCVVLILLLVKEPPRGAAEGGTHLSNTSYLTDIKHLSKNKSFMFSTLGFTAVAFVTGALALWAPEFMDYSIRVQNPPGGAMAFARVSLIFGAITCVAGILGVGLGAESARRLRSVTSRADPLVCSFGLLSCTPFLFLAIYLSNVNTTITWILVFIGETLLCLNWTLVADILLYVVIPTRRSTAESFQIVISHLFGDAGSPYLIGLISDLQESPDGIKPFLSEKFLSLQNSLYVTCFVAVLGGGCFLATALFINQDRAMADKVIKGTSVAEGEESIQGTDETDDDDDDDLLCDHDVQGGRPKPPHGTGVVT